MLYCLLLNEYHYNDSHTEDYTPNNGDIDYSCFSYYDHLNAHSDDSLSQTKNLVICFMVLLRKKLYISLNGGEKTHASNSFVIPGQIWIS